MRISFFSSSRELSTQNILQTLTKLEFNDNFSISYRLKIREKRLEKRTIETWSCSSGMGIMNPAVIYMYNSIQYLHALSLNTIKFRAFCMRSWIFDFLKSGKSFLLNDDSPKMSIVNPRELSTVCCFILWIDFQPL